MKNTVKTMKRRAAQAFYAGALMMPLQQAVAQVPSDIGPGTTDKGLGGVIATFLSNIIPLNNLILFVAFLIGMIFVVMLGAMFKNMGDENAREQVKPLKVFGLIIGAIICFYLSYIIIVFGETFLSNPSAAGAIQWQGGSD